MFRNRKGRKDLAADKPDPASIPPPNQHVHAQIVGAATVPGAKLLFVRAARGQTFEYGLGVRYNGSSTPQFYQGSSDVAAMYRAFLLFVYYLRSDNEPILRRTVGNYAVDCRIAADPRRPKHLDLGREALALVAVIRNELGNKRFVELRDMPIAEMPANIRKLINRG